MRDKQVLIAILSVFLFALVGGVLLFIRVGLFQRDGGDDGFGMIWIFLSVLSGVVGVVLSAKWPRRHDPEESR